MCTILFPVFIERNLIIIYNIVTILSLLYSLTCIIVIFLRSFRLVSKIATHILRNQFVIDFFVVLILIVYLNNTYIRSKNAILTKILCYFWNSQYPFWTLISISINNLTSNCIDRVVAVRWATTYKTTIETRLKIYYSWLFMTPILVNGQAIFMVRVVNNTCSHIDKSTKSYLKLMSIFLNIWCSFSFVIPILATLTSFIVIYTTLRHRSKQGSNAFIRHSEIRFTIVSFITFIILLVSSGGTIIAYYLRPYRIICFNANDPIQKAIMALASLFSISNSILYNFGIKDLRVIWVTFWYNAFHEGICVKSINPRIRISTIC